MFVCVYICTYSRRAEHNLALLCVDARDRLGLAATAAEPREVSFYAQASQTLQILMEKDVHF